MVFVDGRVGLGYISGERLRVFLCISSSSTGPASCSIPCTSLFRSPQHTQTLHPQNTTPHILHPNHPGPHSPYPNPSPPPPNPLFPYHPQHILPYHKPTSQPKPQKNRAQIPNTAPNNNSTLADNSSETPLTHSRTHCPTAHFPPFAPRRTDIQR